MNWKIANWSLATVLAAAMVSACGGGGGSQGSSPPPPPPAQNSPTVSVAFPNFPGLINSDTLTFRGSVSDPDGDSISSITFKDASGNTLVSITPVGDDWSQAVPLDPGLNTITVEATDARGASGATTVEITRELFLSSRVVSPIYDPIAGNAFVLSVSNDGLAPLAAVSIDLDTGTRAIVSGEGVGNGPELIRTERMIHSPNDSSLIVFNPFPADVLRVDTLTGDRTFMVDISATGTLSGAVVDVANNRVLFINRDYDLWSISLADNSLTMLGTIVVPSGNAAPRQGLAVSSDGALLYVHAGPVIAEVNTQTLAVRELVLDDPPDSTTDHLLDENQNRVVYAHRESIISVDRAAATNQELIQVPEDEGYPGFIALGRSDDELLMVDQFDDRLVAIDLTTGAFERLAGSFRGTGPQLDSTNTAYVEASGVLYSSRLTRGASPQDDASHLVRIDPATGDRSETPADFGVSSTFITNAGMAIDSFGNVLWLSTADPNGLFRFDPGTGSGELVVDLGTQFTGGSGFCYDVGSNTGYMLRASGQSEVIALNIDTGMASVLSSEALGIGTGPSAVSLSGLACDPTNSRLLIGDGNTATASVLAVDATTGNRSVISDSATGAGDVLIFPRVLAASPDGSAAYAFDNGNNSLVRIDLTTGDRSEITMMFGPVRMQVLGMTMINDEFALVSDQNYNLWSLDLQSGELILVSK